MKNTKEVGNRGEQIACEYLKQNNYEILKTNWFFQKSEIDIIAKKDNLLIAIEVKTRSSLQMGNPESFVSKEKIKLLKRGINGYVNTYNINLEIRFDIISIYLTKENKAMVKHIEDAFLWF